jgi:Flp pilus assembly protein TadG
MYRWAARGKDSPVCRFPTPLATKGALMILRHSYRTSRRQAVAAVEFAVVLPLILLILLGVWELGRIIHVQQVLTTAARDGARLAAQGTIINTTGAYTQIHFSSGSPNVQDVVLNSLYGAGITNLNGANVTFQFVSGDTGRTDPYQGQKNELFRVRVTIPYDNVRWTSMTLFAPNTLSAEVYWTMMVDDPFTVNTNIPGWSP